MSRRELRKSFALVLKGFWTSPNVFTLCRHLALFSTRHSQGKSTSFVLALEIFPLLKWHNLFYSNETSLAVWHLTSFTVSNYQWITKECRKHLTLLSPIIHYSFFSFLCSKQRTCVSACCCSSARLFTPLLASLNQTLKALISRKHCLEKGSIRYFKNQQWILKPLVRYSA